MGLFKSYKFQDPGKNENSTEFEVNNWEISKFIIEKLVPISAYHPFPLDELMLMTATITKFKPVLVFEWGTNIGKSARIFYEAANAFSISTTIHSIDLPDDVHHIEHPQQKRGMMVKGLSNVILHQADGLSKSIAIFKESNPNGNVLFFIDGDHSYESVFNELLTVLTEVPEAIVLLHDTFYQSENSNYNIGPYMAINDVLNQLGNVNFKRISTNIGLPGMTLVYKKR